MEDETTLITQNVKCLNPIMKHGVRTRHTQLLLLRKEAVVYILLSSGCSLWFNLWKKKTSRAKRKCGNTNYLLLSQHKTLSLFPHMTWGYKIFIVSNEERRNSLVLNFETKGYNRMSFPSDCFTHWVTPFIRFIPSSMIVRLFSLSLPRLLHLISFLHFSSKKTSISKTKKFVSINLCLSGLPFWFLAAGFPGC